MYRRTNTRSHLITPESTPVKQHYNRLRASSGTSSKSLGSVFPGQRRLPRKPAPPLSTPPEQLQPGDNHHLSHPIDFVIDMMFQSFYHRVYLSLATAVQEELSWPIRGICMATTTLTVFITRVAAILTVGLCLGLFAAKETFTLTAKFLLMVYELSARLVEMVRYCLLEVVLLHWNASREELFLVEEPSSSPSFDSVFSPHPVSTCSSPSSQKKVYPLSPVSARGPLHPGFKPYYRAWRTMPPHASTTQSGRSSLGHRAEELHRILADCNETQLESAGILVCDLHTRAQARGRWKL